MNFHGWARVPAKAMLFGEYGVLVGGPAVVALLPHHEFILEMRIEAGQNTEFCLYSDFFATRQQRVTPNESDVSFLQGLIYPWWKRVTGLQIQVRVHRSYSPALGLGSSSALIAGVHALLESALGSNGDTMKSAVLRIQGKGSGYDVVTQRWGTELCENNSWKERFTQLLVYENGRANPLPYPPQHPMGFLLASGVYSATGIALKRSFDAVSAEEHKNIALAYLQNPKRLPELMQMSREVACRQGLFNDQQDQPLLLPELLKGLCWKTMGAGMGDCFWVVEHADCLKGKCIPETHTPLQQNIVFQFDGVSG